jgi:hypothetical protein
MCNCGSSVIVCFSINRGLKRSPQRAISVREMIRAGLSDAQIANGEDFAYIV